MKAYYNETVETVRRDLNGEQDFLTNEEVKRRQEKFGFNELAEGKKKSGLQIFLEQYKDFLVLILIVSAVVSLFLGETESAAVILVVCNFTPVARPDYRVGVPKKKQYKLIMNEQGLLPKGKAFKAEKKNCDNREFSFAYPLEAYGVGVFTY